MPFIGKQPKVGAYQLIDSITTSATATYALTVDGSAYFPETARNLIVSLNGVTQAPDSAYTVSGSNIVFDSALTTSDVIDYILVIGDAVDIGVPSDGTVGNAQLASNIDLSGKTLTLSDNQISGDAIDGGTISNFASTGIDDNATSTAITIDSSQNVGIGGPPTSSSSYRTLNIIGGADVGGALRLSTTANENGHIFQYNDGIYLSGDEVTFISTGDPGVSGDVKTAYRVDRTAELHRWFNPLDGSTEAMRINNAGQLLVGTSSNALDGNISGVGTSSDFTVSGSVGKFQLANTGNLIAFSRNGANYISATGTSASIILDTNRTIIRSEAGSEYARFDGDGLKFNGDLASANALDDYEEGTWTPVLTGTTSGTKNLAGTYTKIGRCVTVRIGHWTAIPSGTLAGSLYITGLPFNSAGNPWGNNGGIASSGLLHIRGTSGGIGTSYAPFALIEANVIKLHDSANFGNTNVYSGQGATFGATKITQNGSTSIIIDWEFSYMTA